MDIECNVLWILFFFTDHAWIAVLECGKFMCQCIMCQIYLLNIHNVTLVVVLKLVLWKYSIIYALLWMDEERLLEIKDKFRKHEKLLTVWLNWVDLLYIFIAIISWFQKLDFLPRFS